MNARDILNSLLYPRAGDNARRKDYPLYDTQTIATGTTEYYFFVTPPGNQYLRNKKMPLAGSEIFFVDEISGYIGLNITTTAIMDKLNELLQQSYLLISVDGRVQCKLPGLDFIQYMIADTFTATGTAIQPRLIDKSRKLPIPIMLNSTSSFEFKLVITSSAATTFNSSLFRLSLHGLQVDKLQSYYYDNLKAALFQQVPVTYYNTVPITGAAENIYGLFNNSTIAPNLFSQVFPLSDITTFSLQNIEVFVNQPDTPIEGTTIYNSRIQNVLKINIDDVDMFNANLQEMLSVAAMFSTSLTTTPDTTVLNTFHIRQSKTLRVPLEIPSNSKVNVSLAQPASSLGITGEITVAFRGVETRRVA